MKLIFFIFSFILSSSIFPIDIDRLSDDEARILVLDNTIRSENVVLNQLYLEAYQLVAESENAVLRVQEAIFSYYEDGISNEELWFILDPIKEEAFRSSEAFENKISTLNFRSKSDKEFWQPIYNFSYSNLSSLNNYLRDYAKNLVNQIGSLEIGDIDKYDMYLSQSQIIGAKLNLSQADIKELGAKIIPSSNVNHFVGQFDAQGNRLAAYFLLINGTYMLDELDKKTLREFSSKANEAFKKQKNANLKRGMFNAIERIEKNFRIFANPDELAVAIDTKKALNLFYLSSINLSENYLKIIELFGNNKDKLSYSNSEGEIQSLSEWDYLNLKINIDAEQTLESGVAFNNGFIELGNIILKYQDTE